MASHEQPLHQSAWAPGQNTTSSDREIYTADVYSPWFQRSGTQIREPACRVPWALPSWTLDSRLLAAPSHGEGKGELPPSVPFRALCPSEEAHLPSLTQPQSFPQVPTSSCHCIRGAVSICESWGVIQRSSPQWSPLGISHGASKLNDPPCGYSREDEGRRLLPNAAGLLVMRARWLDQGLPGSSVALSPPVFPAPRSPC